jgi:hypothetical protein
MSARATNALPASTVRSSRVVSSVSSVLTTVTATTSNPKMAADAPALAVDEALVGARHKSTLSTGAS